MADLYSSGFRVKICGTCESEDLCFVDECGLRFSIRVMGASFLFMVVLINTGDF